MIITKKDNNQHNEFITIRKPLIDIKYLSKKLRVGAILDITETQFNEIFDYDIEKIKELNKKLYNLLEKSDEIKIKTDEGTNLTLKISNEVVIFCEEIFFLISCISRLIFFTSNLDIDDTAALVKLLNSFLSPAMKEIFVSA